MREAPPSKKARLLRSQGKEKKGPFKITKFKPFEGEKSDGNSGERIYQCVNKAIEEANGTFMGENGTKDAIYNKNNDSFAVAQQLNYLICLCMHKRDITDGAGERDLSYFMLIELYNHYPKTMSKLLKIFALDYGSLLDLNKIAVICTQEIHTLGATNLERQEKLSEIIERIVEIYHECFENDEYQTIAAKWAPRQGKSVDRITDLCAKIAEKVFPSGINENTDSQKVRKKKKNDSLHLFRQKCTILNSDNTEVKLCAKEMMKVL